MAGSQHLSSIGGQEEWRFDCGGSRNCVVTGNDGNLAWIRVSRSGQIAIRVQPYPKSWPTSGDAVSCASGRDCFIAVSNVIGGMTWADNLNEVTRDGGRTWAPPVRSPQAPIYLSCPVRAGCVALAGDSNDSLVEVLSSLRH